MSAPRIDTAANDGVGIDGKTRPSEDRVLILANAVILLDGATAVLPEQPSGGWYADVLGEALRAEFAADPTGELKPLLGKAIAHVRDTEGLSAGLGPCATVAILRWSPSEVDALVLADSPIVLRTRSGVEVLSDDRLANLPRGGGGYRARLRSGGGYGDDHLDALRAGVRQTARWRNVEGGYWVAEAEPAAAEQAYTLRLPRAEVQSALLVSDGVSCGVDDYDLFDWAGVFGLLNEAGPEAVLTRVREAELSDPDGRRWPRPKTSDDQALAHVRFA